MNRVIRLLIVLLCSFSLHAEKADFVIFSYDRPLQLYALLESTTYYIDGINQIHVIYRVSDFAYANAYDKVKQAFPAVHFHCQSTNPHKDFKPLTLKAAFSSQAQYILFGVDDIIVKDFVDIEYCIECMKATNAYGFFLRLGTHLTECYSMNTKQPVPTLDQIAPTVFAWDIKKGCYDWGYPNTVDMTLYVKKDIESVLTMLAYYSPNTLEGNWSGKASLVRNRKGLCFSESKIVNLPLNLVQNDYSKNRHQEGYSAADLLTVFNQGLKIDIRPLYLIKNSAAHMEYEPLFIER